MSTLAVAALLTAPSPISAGELSQAQTISLERGRRDLPRVALTFDGGSDAGDTSHVLAVLSESGAPATFFLTGDFIRRNPDLVRRIAAAGHEVGNHTWSHPHLTAWERTGRHDTLEGVDRELVQRELSATARAYEQVTGRSMAPLWRAPYGEVNADLLRWAATAGWRHIGWSRDERGDRRTLDSLDWVADRGSRNFLTSTQIIARLLAYDAAGFGLSGGIVLMHLCTRSVDPGVGRLGELIDALRSRGYGLVTVGEMRRDLVPAEPIGAQTASLSR